MSQSTKKDKGFTDVEKAAMKERARELKAEARRDKSRAAGEEDLLSKIAEMPEPERSMATRLHQIITTTAPSLMPKTFYGMPAYANDEGKIVCFFQSAHKYETRYATLGFEGAAKLDDGRMWAASFALIEITAEEEERIIALLKKAAPEG